MGQSQEMLDVQRDLGRIMEALKNAEGNRQEMLRRFDQHAAKQDQQNEKIDQVKNQLSGVDQSLRSLSKVTENIALERYGDRLNKLEAITKNVPTIETELLFWRHVFGGGIHTVWKIVMLFVGSGIVGAALTKWFIH